MGTSMLKIGEGHGHVKSNQINSIAHEGKRHLLLRLSALKIKIIFENYLLGKTENLTSVNNDNMAIKINGQRWQNLLYEAT